MRNPKHLAVLPFAVAASVAFLPSHAQQSGTQANAQAQATQQDSAGGQARNSRGNVAPIGQWDYQKLYRQGGMRADRLLEATVYNPAGEKIGSVKNALLNQDNRIIALIVQVGGMWDIGDTHVAVPWNEIQLTEKGIQVPIREDNIDDYGLFDESYVVRQDLDQATPVEDDVMTGPRNWKVTDLLDDYASIDGGEGYGYVTNALFSRQGKLQALVIDPSEKRHGKGPFAYPFYGYEQGWHPGASSYEISYSSEEVRKLPRFDYQQYRSQWE